MSNHPLDEQKEPYYLAGQRKLSSLDYKGAVEAFEKAVEANPRSGSAHFQLGLLYEQKVTEENSFAIAVYHYNRFLQLRPESEYAEIVRQKIIACKRELAKPIMVAPGSQSLFHDLERLKVENAQLKSQLEAWAAYATNRQNLVSPPGTADSRPPYVPPVLSNQSASASGQAAQPARTHRVESNETMTSIAKQYGISVDSLMKANPGVNPRRLKIGQELKVPAS